MIRSLVSSLALAAAILGCVSAQQMAQITPAPVAAVPDITPIPMDRFNPRLNGKFRRIDSNGDEKLTFTEFLLGDRPYIEAQSRNFHKHDLNGDGVVTREEFEGYYRRQEEEQRQREIQADNFFKQLGAGLYTDSRDRQDTVFNFPPENVFRGFQPNSPSPSSVHNPNMQPQPQVPQQQQQLQQQQQQKPSNVTISL
uniref:EF-hand domain-containing protein n=1 Tax=Steinernema glaseri TaxID=37863 RepID=A0A1I8AHY0_9BILA